MHKASVTIPDSENRHLGTPVQQEVVELDLIPDSPSSTTIMEQNIRIPTILDEDTSVAMEIVMGNSTFGFFNYTNPKLIRTTLQCLRKMPHD